MTNSYAYCKNADLDRIDNLEREVVKLKAALRELLEFVDISDCENRDLPAYEYEAIGDEAISNARAALQPSEQSS